MKRVPTPLKSHPLYSTWHGTLQRCENPRTWNYAIYGGRGIRVSDEFHDFRKFAAWIELNIGLRPAGLELDRIDNDGNYEAGNLRWATRRQQQAKTRKKYGESRYKGVGMAGNRWRARIVIDGRQRHLGCFGSELEAAHAYDAAACEEYGEFARLNFPERRAA